MNAKPEQSGDYVEGMDEIIETKDVGFRLLFSVGYRLDLLNNSALAAELSCDWNLQMQTKCTAENIQLRGRG